MDVFECIWLLPLLSFAVVVVGLFVVAVLAQIIAAIRD